MINCASIYIAVRPIVKYSKYLKSKTPKTDLQQVSLLITMTDYNQSFPCCLHSLSMLSTVRFLRT